jgi:DNA polymerase elongation subunit (family B)
MGFSFVDAPQSKEGFLVSTVQTFSDEKAEMKKRLDDMYNIIMPFLKNLSANPEKSYINWPDRTKKVTEFIDKINKVYKGVK